MEEQTIEELKNEIESLKLQLKNTQEHLSKYTNPKRHKKYQEENKEKILEYAKKYYYDKKMKN